jgi:DNA repair protein RadA/Sms
VEATGDFFAPNSHPAFGREVGPNQGKGFFPSEEGKELIPISEIAVTETPRCKSGIDEVDRVLGGGFVKGTVALLGAAPGAGKSTLSLQVGSSISKRGETVVYVSGEESKAQARMRAERIKAITPNLMLLCNTETNQILETIEGLTPSLVVVDSIQTLYSSDLPNAPGSQAQLRDSTSKLIDYARRSAVPVLIIGHVTKDNKIAGPRLLEHMVDTVLYLDGNKEESKYRMLRASKGRYADTSEVGIFKMLASGLQPIPDPSTAFLPQGSSKPGSILTVALEGDRGILVEIQALVSNPKKGKGQGKRMTVGLDPSRVQMVESILEYHDVDLSKRDIFLSVAGGYKLDSPEADLPIAMSILSSLNRKEYVNGQRVIAFGEISLDGTIRQATNAEHRAKIATRQGYNHVFSASPDAFLSCSHVLELLKL